MEQSDGKLKKMGIIRTDGRMAVWSGLTFGPGLTMDDGDHDAAPTRCRNHNLKLFGTLLEGLAIDGNMGQPVMKLLTTVSF